MRCFFAVLLCLFCFNNYSHSQEVSKVDKLYVTAKVWGFLKYYHPKVAAGKFDWDQQLFDILPKVQKVQNKKELSLLLKEWIISLGKIKSRVKQQDHEYFDKNFNLDWTQDDRYFSDTLSAILNCIETNRHQGQKHYISYLNNKSGYAEIIHEKPYQNVGWDKSEYRLLSLFRYWNLIEYFFPYKYQMDKNWDEVLLEMIPQFLNAKSKVDYHLSMLALITSIDDSHGGFNTPEIFNYFGNQFIPANVKLVDNKAVVTSFRDDSIAAVNDLQIGDVITKVNGKKIADLYLINEHFITGSNSARKQYNAQSFIFKGTTDSVEIEFERDGVNYSKIINRYPYNQFTRKKTEVLKFKIFDNNVGYLNLSEITEEELESILQQCADTKSIIIDIRNSPNTPIPQISDFITSKKSSFYSAISPDLNYPGRFIWNKGYEVGGDNREKYKGKVVLLVNEQTQSHAEFSAMCLQSGDNVITVGSQTSGADGRVTAVEMIGGYKTQFTGIGIFYPDRSETQRVGVKIDVEITPTIKGIMEGVDEQLEKAIEVANA